MKLMHVMKWLYPGMRVKRWLGVAISGVLMFGIGSALLPVEGGLLLRLLSLVLIVLLLSLVAIFFRSRMRKRYQTAPF